MDNQKQQNEVAEWNKNNKVGAKVEVTLDGGEKVDTKTYAEAQLLGGHTPVVWLEDISGAYLLSRCKAI